MALRPVQEHFSSPEARYSSYNQLLNSSGKILRAAEVGGQGRGMSKEPDADRTPRCSTSSATPNYCNAEQATELNSCGSGESSAEQEQSSRNNCSAFFKALN